jgi:hypothetical protein
MSILDPCERWQRREVLDRRTEQFGHGAVNDDLVCSGSDVLT